MSSRSEVYDFMEEAGMLFFATVKDNKPKLRPIGFRMMEDEQIYFVTGNKKDFYNQMVKNSNIEGVGQSGGKFLRYYGHVAFDEDEDKTLIKKAFEKMPMLEKMLQGKTGQPQVFHITKATAEIRTHTGIVKSYNFLD